MTDKEKIEGVLAIAHHPRNHGHWRGDLSVQPDDSYPDYCVACAILKYLGAQRVPSGAARGDWDYMEPILDTVFPPKKDAPHVHP